MDVAHPYTAVSPSVSTAVLVTLARSREPRSGREVARRTGRSKTGVQHALDQLVAQGTVERMPAGNAQLYSLNRNHLLAGVVEQMADAHNELVKRLRELIASWDIPTPHASLFGSAARRDGDTHSDIDLLIIRPPEIDAENENWHAQLDDLAMKVHAWTGNHAGVVQIAEGELSTPTGSQNLILTELRNDAIDLAGKPTDMEWCLSRVFVV